MSIMEEQTYFENRIDLSELNKTAEKIRAEIGKVIVGQHKMIDLLLAAVLADGHVLIEGVPGTAKTLTTKLLSKTLDVGFSRIQFTPDLMPSDVLGTTIYNPKTTDFEFRKGPIFSNFILIDEINRSPAKTQSALFEVMEERQVTFDGITHNLQIPFLVVATQNPIDHEGTYRLPEAQLDRFMFKIEVTYPSFEEEILVLNSFNQPDMNNPMDKVTIVMSGEKLSEFRAKVKQILVSEDIVKFIAQIVGKTRQSKDIFLGASTRASIAMLNASKAIAALRGRDFVTPEDVKYIASPVLNHRIILTPENEMEGKTEEAVINGIISQIEVPR